MKKTMENDLIQQYNADSPQAGEDDRLVREDALAAEVLDFARQSLTMELRFLDAALNRLKLFPLSGEDLMTDGNALGYDPRFILEQYAAEPNRISRYYLHAVFHCVFHHVFQASFMDRKLWDLACDIAVEYVIESVDAPCVRCRIEHEQRPELTALKQKLGQVTAERIYRYFRDLPLAPEEAARLAKLFRADAHHAWYSPQPMHTVGDSTGGNQGARYQVESEKGKRTEGGSGTSGQTPLIREDPDSENGQDEPAGTDPQEDWEQIARRMKIDMKPAAGKSVRQSGAMLQTVQEVNREHYDYTTFLQKFSVMGEHLKINPDEFDYIYYTYGLQHYGNLPLVEPLEYSEDRHVREFVIAIDTSGSVRGHLVQTFVQKTYNILKTTESFASRVNIHILQCDNEVREHVKIRTLSEFDNYIRAMELKGFGGTDFRPVFKYVDERIKEKEFRNLRGLVYLTDGRGEFPVRKPPYKTAFVFLDSADNNLRIPSWGIPCILREEEILSI